MEFYGEFYDAFMKNSLFFCTSGCVLSYELVKNMVYEHSENFEKSSEFSLDITIYLTGSLTIIGVIIEKNGKLYSYGRSPTGWI